MNEERRGSTLRRQINEIGMHSGEAQESKIWAQVGKGLCVWLIYKHAEILINHWETLFVLLLFLVAPELIKKFITMRWGGGGYTTHTSERSKTVTVDKPSRVDNPDTMRGITG